MAEGRLAAQDTADEYHDHNNAINIGAWYVDANGTWDTYNNAPLNPN